MTVDVNAYVMLRPSTAVIIPVATHPVRHFAKPPGVICNTPVIG